MLVGQPANEANFKKYADLRYRLLPYYAALGWEAYNTGWPVLRPLVLEYPDDPRLVSSRRRFGLDTSLIDRPAPAARARAGRAA